MSKYFSKLALLFTIIYATQSQAQNVGVGTSTPLYKLDVLGRSRIQAGTLNDVFTSAGIWFTDYRNNADIVFTGMADSVNYGFYSQRPGIGWQTYFDARYGNIGLGIKPTSGYRLTLASNSGNNLGLYNGTTFRGSITTTDSTMVISPNRTFNILGLGNDLILQQPGGCVGDVFQICSYPGRIGMYTNKPNSRVHIAASTGTTGVLIGSSTSVPAVGYMVSVDGKIICEELKVQTSGSWPDYVFADGYELPTLGKLEEVVMQQKHLPGIPSAAQVTENKGVMVGEMQKQLLEKVEELYRYMFQMNKEMAGLTEENKNLKSRLLALEKE